jgi:hypothetical protein
MCHVVVVVTVTAVSNGRTRSLARLFLCFIMTLETYHMVDTCDPSVACWSDDGETFVVKDPVKFEQQIIPQFFKHSKFSSFVRVRPFNCYCNSSGSS